MDTIVRAYYVHLYGSASVRRVDPRPRKAERKRRAEQDGRHDDEEQAHRDSAGIAAVDGHL